MYKFEVMYGESDQEKSFTTISEIEFELAQLKDEIDYDLQFTITPPMENVDGIYVGNSSYYKGIFKKTLIRQYFVSINLLCPDGDKDYDTFMHDFDEVKEMIRNFITARKLPDYSGWDWEYADDEEDDE